MYEKIGLIICTTGKRPSQLQRCVDSHIQAIKGTGAEIVNRIFMDSRPSRDLAHLVSVRNLACSMCEERWAFFCDDDDFVLSNHAETLLLSRTSNPSATIIMGQAQDVKGKRLGFSIACSLVNIDRFRMVNWLCPPSGGEDFYTLSTIEVRGHQVIRNPTVTWQVCDEVPSLTRDERVELKGN